MRHPKYMPEPLPKASAKLDRSLSLFDATVYGTGIIIGAGVFVLIGKAAAIAGNSIWISFALSAVIAAFTALSYAELSSMFPKEAAEFVYLKEASGRSIVGFMVGWFALFAGIISVSVVSLGFAEYFTELFGLHVPLFFIAIPLIVLLSLVNFIGIKESARFNTLCAGIAILGLLLIIAIGLPFLGSVDYFSVPVQTHSLFEYLNPIVVASSLIFFAYIGFEDLANIAEETIGARKTIPKAMLLSVAITTILYILVSLVAVSVVPWNQFGKASLAVVASEALGSAAFTLIAVIALFATASTALVILIADSRRLFGMSEEGILPKVLSRIHPKTQTPHIAVFMTMAMAIAFVLPFEIESAAFLTTLSVFIIFFTVNIAVIVLRFTKPDAERQFRIPLSIGRIPVLPVFGAASCLFIGVLSSFSKLLELSQYFIVITAAVLGLGLISYYVFNR